jgi:hypothetical protein
MKSILLASASIVAFAGAAAAEVKFSGSAELGYNDTDTISTTDDDEGFFWSAGLDVTYEAMLNNGLTAGATFTIDIADNDLGIADLDAADYVLFLKSDTAGLYFGNTEFAAQTHWDGAGSMASDGFSEEDGETVLRGDVTFGGVSASVSYAIADDDQSLVQLSVGAHGAMGNFTYALAYQEEVAPASWQGGDFNTDGIFGVSVGTTFAGATVQVAYAQNETQNTDSLGLEVSYPIGPVTLGAYYVLESDTVADGDAYGISASYASGPVSVKANYEDTENGAEDWSIEGSYDVGNGIVVYAGVADAGEDYYAAGTLDLGSGASLLVSYADDGDNDSEDEIGANDYKDGATVSLTFTF